MNVRETCPACGKPLVGIFGRPASRIAIVGDAPGLAEQKVGRPWIGDSSEVLKSELRRAGMDFNACRATNFWLHAPTTKGSGEELYARCYEYNYTKLLEALSGVRAVLLMGADLTHHLTGMHVGRVNGMPVTSALLPSTVEVLVATFNPAIALSANGVIGDFRFAVEQFVHYTKPIYKEMTNGR